IAPRADDRPHLSSTVACSLSLAFRGLPVADAVALLQRVEERPLLRLLCDAELAAPRARRRVLKEFARCGIGPLCVRPSIALDAACVEFVTLPALDAITSSEPDDHSVVASGLVADLRAVAADLRDDELLARRWRRMEGR